MKFKKNNAIVGRIEITPMVDVVFLLVIYFLVASSLQESASIEVNLPEATKAVLTKVKKPILISISSKNRIYIGDKKKSVPIKYLGDRIVKMIEKSDNPDYKKQQIIIRGDEKSQYKMIIRIMDELSLRNIKNFNLSVSKKPGK